MSDGPQMQSQVARLVARLRRKGRGLGVTVTILGDSEVRDGEMVFENWGTNDVRFRTDSTSTPEQYLAKVEASLRAKFPDYRIVHREWVRIPNGFWRRLFRRPERGYYTDAA